MNTVYIHNNPFQRNKIDVRWPTALIKTISGWLLYRRHFPLKIKNITKRDKTKLWICGEAPTLRENFKFGRFPDSCSFQQTQHLLKGQSNQNFDLQFFSSFEPAWATDQWVKTVSFLISFSSRYSYFSGVLRSIILRGVKFPAV